MAVVTEANYSYTNRPVSAQLSSQERRGPELESGSDVPPPNTAYVRAVAHLSDPEALMLAAGEMRRRVVTLISKGPSLDAEEIADELGLDLHDTVILVQNLLLEGELERA